MMNQKKKKIVRPGNEERKRDEKEYRVCMSWLRVVEGCHEKVLIRKPVMLRVIHTVMYIRACRQKEAQLL